MINTILWDFDGVILDSMEVRDLGFREIFNQFDSESIEKLIIYHRKNGGLSRYVKIRYFFEKIIGKYISDNEVQKYANDFSIIMREKLVNQKNLIKDSLNFIKKEHKNYKFHIVSGSDQAELRYLCRELKIDNLFISIHGSPTPKKDLITALMKKYEYLVEQTCLIGDSINDYEAANANKITFFGFNNESLKDFIDEDLYINHFSQFTFDLCL
ncbi:HAD-IA family hydrolase [Ascidiimonas aurantiaca]|uniref:HAD family hydrolase n=1 Tax=Ascidiimonas aurantiaca TaxID=1685432 RepID=UPI0030EC5B0F